MSDPTFTEAPAQVPSRAVPSTFSALTDPFIAWEKTFRNELSSSVSWFALQVSNAAASAGAASDSAGEAASSAGAASDSAGDAADSAALAISGGAAAAGADVHVPNAPYTASNPASAVVSNVNGQTYRCIVSHSGVATDPANDGTRWVQISFGGLDFETKEEAEAGTGTEKPMNALRTAQAIAALAAGGNVVKEAFATSGTFTKESDDLVYRIEVWSAGGGGGYRTAVQGCGGGGGGGYRELWVLASEIGATVSVVVGAGGDGGNPNTYGGDGGASSFGSLISVPGGAGGNDGGSSNDGGESAFPFAPDGILGGKGGGNSRGSGSSTVNGGGGGGGYSGSNGTGGTSVNGGAGGNCVANGTAGNGVAPGGGGGAAPGGTPGNGARGEIRITRFKG